MKHPNCFRMIWDAIGIVRTTEKKAWGKWNPKGYNSLFIVSRKFWTILTFWYDFLAFAYCASGTCLCVFSSDCGGHCIWFAATSCSAALDLPHTGTSAALSLQIGSSFKIPILFRLLKKDDSFPFNVSFVRTALAFCFSLTLTNCPWEDGTFLDKQQITNFILCFD